MVERLPEEGDVNDLLIVGEVRLRRFEDWRSTEIAPPSLPLQEVGSSLALDCARPIPERQRRSTKLYSSNALRLHVTSYTEAIRLPPFSTERYYQPRLHRRPYLFRFLLLNLVSTLAQLHRRNGQRKVHQSSASRSQG